ncbi:MAG: hypothetical protein HY329_15245 [Chloroflexi bacterium]|nr:hypothetical protein [Chloroflexota bacterium]
MSAGEMNLENVKVGTELPPLERTLTLTSLVTYAGATWDWHRYHYDAAHAQSLGLPGPFVDGQMFGGLMAKLVLDWAGPDARLRSLKLRYRSMVFAGERVICRGTVAAAEERDGQPVVRCELSVTTPDGRAVVDGASAVVELTSQEPK